MSAAEFHQKRNDYKTYNQRINQDEVEAGSILVALANHKPKSMSIHNLLESEHKQHRPLQIVEPSHDKRHLPSTPPNDLLPFKPDVVDGRMQTISGENYFGHMHHQKYHQQNQQHQPYAQQLHYQQQHKQQNLLQKQQQQQQQQHQQQHYKQHAYGRSNHHNNQHRYHPYHPSDKKPTTIIVSKQQQLPQNHHEFSRQYINMKRNPKIRRNALQAYISYMTYTDIARKRMKQGVHPTPTLSPPHAYQYQPRYDVQQQPSPRRPSVPTVNKVIVDKPLTAFLHRPSQEQQLRYPPKRDLR